MRTRNNEHLKKNLTDACLQIIHMTELLNYDSHPEFIESGIDDGVNLYITSIGGKRYMIHIPNRELNRNEMIALISNTMTKQEYPIDISRQKYPTYISNENFTYHGLIREYH